MSIKLLLLEDFEMLRLIKDKAELIKIGFIKLLWPVVRGLNDEPNGNSM